ncbi:MAG TPA: 30S ribosome-binding factor RbfA [Puia sp.]|nr:30S ribosome-binding factor RbfA [Puia sp.]
MQEGKRQKQVSALLMQELSDIFQRLGLSMIDGGMASLTAVRLTPDLLEARVYLSLFQVKDAAATMKKIEERGWEIKRELAHRVKHQLRRIPTLQYFYDDTLEHADKMEALFRKIQGDRPADEGTGEKSGTAGGGEEGPAIGKRPGKQGMGEQKPRGEEGPA